MDRIDQRQILKKPEKPKFNPLLTEKEIKEFWKLQIEIAKKKKEQKT
jgi:hypothetical protein